MTTTQEPTVTATQTPVRREVEIDTQLAELWTKAAQIRGEFDSIRTALAHALHIRGEYYGRSKTPVFPPLSELLEQAQAKLADGNVAAWDTRILTSRLERYNELVELNDKVRAETAPLEAEYDAAPWSRFFLVNNTGGHIHSSMSCSTCHITTSFSWLPELSGLSEADAVAEHGAILCTVCFPSAPVEWTNKYELEAEEKAAAKKATQCPGSGTWDHDSSGLQYASPRARCNHCRQTVSVTSTGKLRGHKPPEAN